MSWGWMLTDEKCLEFPCLPHKGVRRVEGESMAIHIDRKVGAQHDVNEQGHNLDGQARDHDMDSGVTHVWRARDRC